jgi:hypothetical protein
LANSYGLNPNQLREQAVITGVADVCEPKAQNAKVKKKKAKKPILGVRITEHYREMPNWAQQFAHGWEGGLPHQKSSQGIYKQIVPLRKFCKP